MNESQEPDLVFADELRRSKDKNNESNNIRIVID